VLGDTEKFHAYTPAFASAALNFALSHNSSKRPSENALA
jgi:hypothetical protein